jgi:hypothetical protein
MVICNPIGYFILVLSAPLPLVQCDPFTFGFFRFYLSAMPSLPPATLPEHRSVCFSSGPPSCYSIPLFDARTHLGQRASS